MRILFAALVTALALFFFGFVWWGLLMPVIGPAKAIADQALVEKMSTSLSESGVYFYPDPAVEPGDASGPMAILYFNTDMPQMEIMMGLGFGHMFATAILVGLFVSSRKLPAFSERFVLVSFIGLLVALWTDIGNLIWWRYPLLWAMYHLGYDIFSWLLAALILAAFLKPSPSHSSL